MKSGHDRLAEAYVMMAEKACYRPQAPSDGFGNIRLTENELSDVNRLMREANDYASKFVNEEDEGFDLGVTDYTTSRAVVFAVEACRSLCAVQNKLAIHLLKMAIEEIEKAGATK